MARNIHVGDWAWHKDRARGLAWTKEPRQAIGCHLVARAERLAEVWPTDEAFRRFAAEVADAVQAAIGRGDRIISLSEPGTDFLNNERLMCPIGSVFAVKGDSWDVEAPRRFPITDLGPEQASFVSGFDDRQDVARDPYYRLGQAYRRRFVAGAGGQS